MLKLRNIAIIAHVDHGKTTLVDKLITHGQKLKDQEAKTGLILDNNDLERERGITILAKNVAVNYKGYKINIIDTPGHSDFGGEVERVLNMADGVLLVVDAFEGTMPQTRYVLEKALSLGLKPIVVINKVDKPNCRPDEVQEEVFDLMFNLNASEEQLAFPTLYGSAKQGWMSLEHQTAASDLTALLDCIISYVPEPKRLQGTPQMLITSLDYSSYVGRIAIGKLHRGKLTIGQNVSLLKPSGHIIRSKIKELLTFEGIEKRKVEEVEAGDLCAIVGIEGFEIGDTVADYDNPEALPTISVDEPTMSMLFTINDSPFYGREGKFVTSRQLKERLDKELEKNLALRLEETNKAEAFTLFGRGVLHLSILIEEMRREGYEMQVGQPQVIIKMVGGEKCEPIEILAIDLPEEVSGKCIELVTRRKGVLLQMERKGDRLRLEFEIPSRGIIGLRNQLLTASAGEAIISHRFKGFETYRGEIELRRNGSLIAMESGTSFAYALNKLQDRGSFFIDAHEEVYTGQVVGENSRPNDLVVNVTKSKKHTNMRASGSDEKVQLAPPIKFSLEEALEYIQADEYVEVTPKSMRLRKIILDENQRKRAQK